MSSDEDEWGQSRKKVTAPPIDKFFQKLDFIKAKDVDSLGDGDYNPVEEMRQYANKVWEEGCKFEEVKAAFEICQRKMCVKGHGEKGSPFAYLSEWAVRKLIDVLNDHLREMKKKQVLCDLPEGNRVVESKGVMVYYDGVKAPKDQKKEVLYQFWKVLITFGPGSGHLDSCLSQLESELCDYIQTFKGAKFKDLLQTLRKEFTCPDNCDREEYVELFKDRVPRIFCPVLTDKQKDVGKKDLVDLLLYYLTKMSQVTEPYISQCLSEMISACYKWPNYNPYKGIADAGFLKSHLSALKEIVQKSKLTEDFSERMRHTLEAIIATCFEEGMIEQMFPELMSVLLVMAKSKTCRDGECMEAFTVRLFGEMNVTDSKQKDMLLTVSCKTFVATMETKPLTKTIEETVDGGMRYIVGLFMEPTKEQAPALVELLKGLVESGSNLLVQNALKMIDSGQLKNSATFHWKNHISDAKVIIERIGQLKVDDIFGDKKDTLGSYQSFIWSFLEMLRKSRLVGQLSESVVNCIFSCLTIDPPKKTGIASYCCYAEYIDLKKNVGFIGDILKKVTHLLKDPDYPYLDNSFSTVAVFLLKECVNAFSDKKSVIPKEQYGPYMELIRICLVGDIPDKFYYPDDCDYKTVYYTILQNVATRFVNKLGESSTLDQVAGLLPDVIRFIKACKHEEDEKLVNPVYHILWSFGRNSPECAQKHMEFIIELFLEWEKCSETHCFLDAACVHFPETIVKHMDPFFDKLKEFDDSNRQFILTIFYKLSCSHPEVYKPAHIKRLLNHYSKETVHQSMVLTIVYTVAQKHPQCIGSCFIMLLDDEKFDMASMNMRIYIIGYVGPVSETHAKQAIDYLMKHIDNADPNIGQIAMGQLLMFGKDYMEMMKPYKAKVENLQETTLLSAVKQLCEQIINIIEGRNVENLVEDMQEMQDDIDKLDTRVGDTEVAVVTVDVKVNEQEKDVKKVKQDVKVVRREVKDVATDLGETKIKVEEIDNKTMTNAPKWSRDLTKLMNPKAEADWRLLALRLGYHNDDIRAWATQNDPCMALLSEWYATHKTSEATYGVLKILQEINRMDGAVIVENAMKAVEGVVEDEDFEYPSPPPVFLSYQWGFQDEVRLLNKHMEKAGYQCWMDIGQMGGGDKLFEKIDSGVRAAKIVICCVTEKYAQSPNCNREVNLAVNLGKPMIPLLMEKMNWPPKGSMGPIFSEYLFIRFFQRGGEETKDDRYWPVPKFQELLMQLNGLNIVPDESAISKEYRNWWKPIEAQLKIDKTKGLKGSAGTQQAVAQAVDETKSPDVFISYQWGKQPQIIALYKRLTGLGYLCWMDIHQMGGGDSLYDKIDRGVRGCKVVLSCVTQKYSLSANCRREVSLADALKKPLIPLLLEQMEWPPPGPMSMVLTQLLYINFYRDPKVQSKWTGPQFEELLDKIQSYMPDVQRNQSSKEDSSKTTTKSPLKAIAADGSKEDAEAIKKAETGNSANKKQNTGGSPVKEKGRSSQEVKGQEHKGQVKKEKQARGLNGELTETKSQTVVPPKKSPNQGENSKIKNLKRDDQQQVRGRSGKSEGLKNEEYGTGQRVQHAVTKNQTDIPPKRDNSKKDNTSQTGSTNEQKNTGQKKPTEAEGSKSCQIL